MMSFADLLANLLADFWKFAEAVLSSQIFENILGIVTICVIYKWNRTMEKINRDQVSRNEDSNLFMVMEKLYDLPLAMKKTAAQYSRTDPAEEKRIKQAILEHSDYRYLNYLNMACAFYLAKRFDQKAFDELMKDDIDQLLENDEGLRSILADNLKYYRPLVKYWGKIDQHDESRTDALDRQV